MERTHHIWSWLAVPIFTLLISGCIDTQKADSTPLITPPPKQVVSIPSPPPAKLEAKPPIPAVEKKDTTAEISSPNSIKNDTETIVPTPAAVIQPKTPTKEETSKLEPGYSVVNPTLMGLRIHDTFATVERKHGIPSKKFIMEDETDPIIVHQYEGFLIGISKLDRVRFIEITSSQIDPGLHGFRLGGHSDEAVQLIGEPDTNTDYVISYTSNQVILKLDKDPKMNTILSIKLFLK